MSVIRWVGHLHPLWTAVGDHCQCLLRQGLHNKVLLGRGEIRSSGCCASDNKDEELMAMGAFAKRADIKLRGRLSWNSS